MNYLDIKIENRIREKLKTLQLYRPLSKLAVAKIKEQFRIEMIYNSNAIEGNSLNLQETFWVINEGMTIKGKPLKDHLEAKNHSEALDYLYEIVSKKQKSMFSEILIRSLNQLVIQNIDTEWAGKYRNSEVIITGSTHNPPQAINVPKLMSEFMLWFRKNKNKLNIIELAAITHYKLVAIHPFFDGNGRTARLLMNIILLESDYPLSIILKNDRKRYYNVLSKADDGDLNPMVNFAARAVERSLDIYLKMLVPNNKSNEKFISLKDLSEQSSFSSKYLNLLARSGKLEAHKERRNWISSKKALERYLENRDRKR